MSNAGGYQNYKEQSVSTMTRGEMLNLLYEEMIKRLTRAKLHGQKEDYVMFEKEINRSKEILTYLTSSLNRKYAISAELARLYDYIAFQLSRVSAGRNVDLIDEVIPFIIELRDTFKEADRIAKKGNSVAAVGG